MRSVRPPNTVTASLTMRQLAAYSRRDGVAAMGPLERTLFTLDQRA
jgi:hypothetical protein